MKFWYINILVVLFLSASPMRASQPPAKEIEVKEVKLVLFGKQVTGFQVLLTRSSKTVYNAVLKHVSDFTDKAFEFENSIIYENILYPPVIRTKEVSLYFLVHPLPGNYCELTYVVMYDYKRSVSSKEFPDLTMKTLVDLASIVRKLTGDDIRFESLVLDEKTMARIAEDEKKREEEAAGNKFVEYPGEEDVKKNDALILKNPFGPDTASSLAAAVNEKANLLQKRENEILKRENELKQREEKLAIDSKYTEEVLARSKSLQDTVFALRKRMGESSWASLAGDGMSVSARDAESLSIIEDQLKSTQKENAQSKAMIDSLLSLVAKIQLQNSKGAKEREALEEDLRSMRQENTQLRSDYLVLKSRVTGLTTGPVPGTSPDEPRLKELSTENENLKKQIQSLKEELAKAPSVVTGPAGLDETQKLRDSLSRLQKQLALIEDPSKAISEISAIRNEILDLQKENEILRRNKEELEGKLKTSSAALKEVQSASEAMLLKVEGYQKQTTELKNSLEKAEGNLATTKTEVKNLRDSLRTFTVSGGSQERRVRELEQKVFDHERQSDSLRLALNRERTGKEELTKKLEQQARYSDSLAAVAAEVESLRNISTGDQVQKLLAQEKALNERDRIVMDREKLLAQREANLDQRKKDLDALEAKYKDIVDRETRLKTLEQQLRQKGAGEILEEMKKNPAPPPATGPDPQVMVARAKEGENTIPLFQVETPFSLRDAELQVAAFMTRQGYLPDRRFPDLEYDNARISLLGEAPLSLRFRLSDKGNGTQIQVSFRQQDATYVDPARNVDYAVKVRDFIVKLVKYKY